MQQNIKSVVEDIAEEVRKNDIIWVKNDYLWTYAFWKWKRLKIWNIEYKLEKSESILECSDIKNICKIVKTIDWTEVWPLTNSKVSITNLEFNVTWSGSIPKVSINFTARAGIKNWLRSDLAERTVINFQTTISERYLKVK
jgi:hypothetical protein